MAGKAAYLDHLAKVSLFSGLTKRDLQRIARATDTAERSAGTILLQEGVKAYEAFIVVEGSATVRRNNRKIATVGPGAILGELALLDRGPRTATVTADTDMELLVLDARHFKGILEEVPALAIKLLETLAKRIRELDKAVYG